ncbi:DUF4302 domain-containing protein [Pedobacter frigidisoli]|uniref:DUF4302 domain-containing protein n=1 Tax=Pedobacter frigidisoli TaxID=2530455 RepID=A0A4V2MN67_9SPHI|nr:DUF4302 domain-containing protein [Pedobacter frigidisoli]TCD11600.1 DUF4302 domain-containing protein [Pedobacter frigidisoli]
MKKLITYIILLSALLTGCEKKELLIDGLKPETRITDALEAHYDMLKGSTYGWKATYYPRVYGGDDPYANSLYSMGYSFHISFNDKNRVTMLSDLSPDAATKSTESSYRIKAAQNLVLYFDTFGYIPTLHSTLPFFDVDFTFDKVLGDTIKMTGQISQSKLVLVKATQAEQTAYNSKGLLNIITASNAYLEVNKKLFFQLEDGTKTQIKLDYTTKAISFAWVENGELKNIATKYTYSTTGLLLKEPISFKGKPISELIWDPVKKLYYISLDAVRTELAPFILPLFSLYQEMSYNRLRVIAPDATTYPGWGIDFEQRRAAIVPPLLAIPFYNFRLGALYFNLKAENKTLILLADVYTGPNRYQMGFYYTYTVSSTGLLKFTLMPIQPITNESVNAGFTGKIADPLITERFGSDQFTVDYLNHPVSGALLGQLKSVEHPTFTVSGTLVYLP